MGAKTSIRMATMPPPRIRSSRLPSTAKQRGPVAHARDHGDGAGQGGGHRADEDVAIAHVAKLVRQHALHLLVGQQVQDALVMATEACCGLRPVAKALGESDGMTYIFGMGMPIFWVRRSTIS